MKFNLTPPFIVAMALLSSMVITAAQTPALPSSDKKKEVKEAPMAHVSIVALGAIAKRRYTIGKGKNKQLITGIEDADIPDADPDGSLPIMLDERPGEFPPSVLFYKVGKRDGKDQHDQLRIGFNNPASVNKIKPNKSQKLLRRDNETGEFTDFMTLPSFPEYTQSLIFLTQKSKKVKRWFDPPIIKILNLNSAKLKNASLYLQNLSTKNVLVKISNDDPIILRPNQGTTFTSTASMKLVKLQVASGRGAKTRLINTAIRLPANNLTTYAFYDANPATNSGKAIGVCRVVTTRVKFPEKNE